QLTMAAIAIDTDDKSRSGKRTLPAQSLYAMPGGRGYERLILVGGGIRVEDAAGNTLAGYTPTEPDAANPIGNSMTGTLRFSVPLSVLGVPEPNWTYVVVAGAQDDHGGAGIGEFRAVHAEQGEWNGGGKLHAEEPNIYDELITP
ncbi:MAG TPA: glucodextranase DOMON-like domain-containing protein, partial [Bacteroidota bacterium]|nr:glucodextranase DOMON-like domain-containing protein [Bacteroidota bacterium]